MDSMYRPLLRQPATNGVTCRDKTTCMPRSATHQAVADPAFGNGRSSGSLETEVPPPSRVTSRTKPGTKSGTKSPRAGDVHITLQWRTVTESKTVFCQISKTAALSVIGGARRGVRRHPTNPPGPATVTRGRTAVAVGGRSSVTSRRAPARCQNECRTPSHWSPAPSYTYTPHAVPLTARHSYSAPNFADYSIH